MGDIEQNPSDDAKQTVLLRTVSCIDDVPAAEWDICARGEAAYLSDPFVSHAFLHALEASGSATSETGWMPRHRQSR